MLKQKEAEKQWGLLGYINAFQFLTSGAVLCKSLSDGKLLIEIDFKEISSINDSVDLVAS